MQDKRYNFKHIFLIIKTAPCDRESVVYADTGPISLEFIIPAFIFAYRLKGNAGAISINLKCRKSSRRKTKVVSFPPTFVFRPLTPPYVPFGIRRFLIFGAFGHSSPLDMGILPCEGWHWMQPISLLGSWLLTNTLCSHFPTYRPSVVRYRTFEGSLPVYVASSSSSRYTSVSACVAIGRLLQEQISYPPI